MTKHAYINKRLTSSSLHLIEVANEIIDEYSTEGYDLTLRQLYYQFVARDIISNTEKSYKRLGGVINDARLVGLIDWEVIIDRTRYLRKNSHWDSPRDIIEACANQFQLDVRSTQKNYIEVWIEKDALIGIVENVCSDLDVPCFSCRGYISQSAMWRAARRHLEKEACGDKNTYILHLGDHDPSGIDMTRDIEDRMSLFGSNVAVRRLALNMEQIDELSPPPNPAKFTDSRYARYISQYGHQSWELDALEPSYIDELVTTEIQKLTNQKKYKEQLRLQKEHRRTIMKITNEMWE